MCRLPTRPLGRRAVESLILVSRIHIGLLYSSKKRIIPGTVCFFFFFFSQCPRKLAFSCGTPCSDYLHAPRLASLLGAGASAGALLGASSIGDTTNTSAPSGALLGGSIVYLLSLAGDQGVLRFTSTFRLASLGARSWYWRSPGAPSTGVSHALALSRSMVSRAVALFYGASPSQPVLSSQLSYSRRLPYVSRSSALLYSYWKIYSRNPNFSKT